MGFAIAIAVFLVIVAGLGWWASRRRRAAGLGMSDGAGHDAGRDQALAQHQRNDATGPYF